MSVTAAQGFVAAGVAAGIKATGKRDLALVANVGPRRCAAGVFTSNRFQAAPVVWSVAALAGGQLDAVVLNSGGANACTGDAGLADARAMAAATATALGTFDERVAVCSTGLIGVRLPMDAVTAGIAEAAVQASAQGGAAAAEAIMTTDTVSKQASLTSEAGWTVGGMAKGAGMLAPALATMLVVVTTDADLTPEQADAALRAATRVTFDRTDSDGCMSTNDTVILLASGASEIVPDLDDFTEALTGVCASLARQLLADAGIFDRFACYVAHGKCCTAARITIQLGQDHAGQRQGIAERLGRIDRILAKHRVDNEQRFDRFERRMQLGDLFHHRLVDRKTPRRIDQ